MQNLRTKPHHSLLLLMQTTRKFLGLSHIEVPGEGEAGLITGLWFEILFCDLSLHHWTTALFYFPLITFFFLHIEQISIDNSLKHVLWFLVVSPCKCMRSKRECTEHNISLQKPTFPRFSSTSPACPLHPVLLVTFSLSLDTLKFLPFIMRVCVC